MYELLHFPVDEDIYAIQLRIPRQSYLKIEGLVGILKQMLDQEFPSEFPQEASDAIGFIKPEKSDEEEKEESIGSQLDAPEREGEWDW